MQKQPKIIAAKFHAIFTTQVQMAVIGCLLGLILTKWMGA
jgi:hypothetical protein